MRTSDAGIAAIKAHEGLRLEAYKDPGSATGLPITIGHGSTRRMDGSPWILGDRITEAEAEALLRRDLEASERAVAELVTVPLNQAQFDALVSFVFNVGAGAFKSSTMLRLLNAGDYQGAAAQFGRWVYNDGQVLAGLERRRAAERALFAQGAEQPPAPIVESVPIIVNTPKEPAMSPWLITALPALVEAIPGLIRNFGKGEVTERNAQAAERVLGIVQAATGASNAQGAVEAVTSDPAARAAATEALDREGWFVITEAGGGGIEGARAFSLAARGPFWELPAFWISLLLLLPLYAVVAAVLFQDGWADTIRVQVVTAILGVVGIVGAFWLGSSFSSQRKDSALIGK